MKGFDWADIELFLAVNSAGSFLKAAERTGTTQPTIGRRVDQLEERLGTKLFERTRAGVVLTPFAKSLLPAAEKMARSAKQISKLASSQTEDIEGTVGISAPDGMSAFWIVPQLAKLQRRYPKLRVTLNSGIWPSEHGRLTSDLAIDFKDPPDKSTVRVPLCWLHYSLFASKDFIERHEPIESIAQAIALPFVKHVSHVMQRDQWDQKAMAADALLDGEFFTNSSAASLMAIRTGVGIGALPTYVRDLFPELVPLKLGKAASLRLYLYYSSEVAHTARVKETKAWLLDMFSPKKNKWFREEFIDPSEGEGNYAIDKLSNSSAA